MDPSKGQPRQEQSADDGQPAVRLFLSCAGVDPVHAEAVAKALEAVHEIRLFRDSRDRGWGANWQDTLGRTLLACDAFLLLVGPGPVRNWTLAETRMALSRHFAVEDERKRLLILPLLMPEAGQDDLPPFLRPFQPEHWPRGQPLDDARWLLPKLQARLDGGDGSAATRILLEPAENPFRMLEAFGRDDARLFFGRQQDIAELLTRLGWYEGGRQRRWLQIEGESGCGKSSLILAGLLPAIDAGWRGFGHGSGACTVLEPMQPRKDVLTELATTLARAFRKPPDGIRQNLASADDRALTYLLRGSRLSEGHALVLVIDQFQELLTVQADRQAVQRFDRQLATALWDESTGLHLITGARSDLLDFDPLPDLQRCLNELGTRYQLNKIDERQLRQIIFDLPATPGLAWSDPELPKEILAQALKEPAPLPAVQFVLGQLWENRENGRLSRRHFDPRRGDTLGGKLGDAAEQLLRELHRHQREALNLLLELTVERGDGGYARRPLDYAAALHAAGGGRTGAEVIERLAGSREKDAASLRLLTVLTHPETRQPRQVELIHEVLLRQGVWPTLWAHLEANRERHRLRDLLELKAMLWSPKRGLARWTGLATREELRRAGVPTSDRPRLMASYLRRSRVRHRLAEFGLVTGLALAVWIGEAAYRVEHAQLPLGYVPAMMMTRLGFPPLPDLIAIPPEPSLSRTFRMGSADSPFDDERPVHQVTVDHDLRMSRHEITFGQYDVHALDLGKALPYDQGWGRGSRPVINVDWRDAVDYAEWLSERIGQACRLPSEAEWEYAARAGGTGDFGPGENNQPITEADLGDHAWYGANAGRQTQPVGTRRPNAWGLHDMHGNVWEWVQDCWHDDYRNAPADGAARAEAEGGDCSRRVMRGGSWNYLPSALRAAERNWHNADVQLSYLGFRVVCQPRP